MIKFLENIAFSVERNIKNVPIAFRIYGIIFGFCFIVFGIQGILPLIGILKEKMEISRELTRSYAVMETNLENAKQASADMEQNRQAIQLLDRYMPRDTNVQSYMLDFIDSIGAAGFTLKNFTQDMSSVSTGQVDISIALEGMTYPTDIVKNIETLKRVTQVKRVTVSQTSRGVSNINLVLTIFTLGI